MANRNDEHDDHEEEQHEESAECNFYGFMVFVLGLISGTFSALTCKMAYDTMSIGVDGTEKAFAKPIMMLLLMFAAMVPAIFFWAIQQFFLPKEDRDVLNYKTLAVLVVPSLCDLLCTLLLLVAQLYITASLWQMMRGSIVVITSLLKSFVLKHKLKLYMWTGVGIITIAMLIAASTSFMDNPDKSAAAASKDPRIGIMLVVLGCIAQGVQYVFEEKVMSVDNVPPLVVIGCEGIWGTLLTLVLVYPLAYALPGADSGHFENPYDAIAMIQNSPLLFNLVICFVITVTMYNVAAVYVTKYLSAIYHAILDNFRPITIWAAGLFIHSMGSRE
jgi:drug/metabolite transporter (DMT)-like permease